ncbi:MAG: hypothetical protein U1E74_02710 [Paenacidovorax caeni]
MSTLLLILPPTLPGPHTSFGYLVSPDGHQIERQGNAAPALLLRPGARAKPWPWCVQALSWQRHAAAKPAPGEHPTPARRLEGLLEDRLLDDPAQLHFALRPAPALARPPGLPCATVPGCSSTCSCWRPRAARSRA